MRATKSLLLVLAVVLIAPLISTGPAAAEEHLFTETVGFATKTGYRGVFAWEATEPVMGFVRYGTDPDALDQIAAAIPGAPDTAGMAIAEGLTIGETYHWLVEDDLTGEQSPVSSFDAVNAYTSWDGSTYTLDLLVQLDTESLPPGIPADMAIGNIAQGMSIFAERLYDAMDGFARLGTVLVTDTNLDYGGNVPVLPPGCLTGVTNAADVLVQTSVPFDSHTFAGWSIEDPCISFYVGRLGQLVIPWGFGGSDEDLHFGYVATHELMHYGFNAPDLYNTTAQEGRASGCWNLDWDGSLMHNTGGWAGTRWELTELDRNPGLTPCDHQHSPVHTWDALRERYTNVPLRPDGPIENVVDTLARGNPDGDVLDIRILDREPSASSLNGFVASDGVGSLSPCVEPGVRVLTDPAFDATTSLPAHDVLSASVAEPFDLGPGRLVFTLEVASLEDPPSNTTWPIVFRDHEGADRWVRMATDAVGTVSFAAGTGTNPSPFAGAGTAALDLSGFDPDGTIRIVVDRSSIGDPAPGDALTGFLTRVRVELPSGGALTPDNMPNDLVGAGIYTVAGSENCLSAPPVAQDDAATTAEDEAIVVPVLDNDSDPDGDPLTITNVSAPAFGTAEIVGDAIRYTPNRDFNGTDAFMYSVTDGKTTAAAAVTVTVTPVPDPPQAFDDRATIPAGTSFRIPVVDNDRDPDGDELTPIDATDPANGATQANQDGSVRYTPDPGFSGTDVFEYTVSDGALTDVGTVTVVVLPEGSGNPCVPPGPVLVEDPAGDHPPGSPADLDVRSVSAAGVLPDGQLVFTMRVDGPTNPPTPSAVWRVRFDAPNGTTYYVSMETLDATGDPEFRYGSIAGSFISDLGPADSGSVSPDGVIQIGIATSKVFAPPGATLSALTGQTQVFVGAPGVGGFVQADVTDEASYLTAGCLVEPPNEPPSAIDDAVTVDEDDTVTVDVLANDSDRNGDPLEVISFSDGLNGRVSARPDGTLVYEPNADFNGEDSFVYTISDGEFSASATVTVTVEPVNDAPVAFDDQAATDEDTAVTIPVTANDVDVDGDVLTVEAAGPAMNGTLGIDGGSVTYEPDPNYHGNDVFNYTVSDGNGASATATVVVTVAAVNDAPIAVDDHAEVPKNRSLTIAVLINDFDVDGDVLEVISTTNARFGFVRLNMDDSITYIPRKGFKDEDSFEYTVSDGNGGFATAVVTIEIVKN